MLSRKEHWRENDCGCKKKYKTLAFKRNKDYLCHMKLKNKNFMLKIFLHYVLLPFSIILLNTSCNDDSNIEEHSANNRRITPEYFPTQKIYPHVSSIYSNPTVRNAMNSAWEKMKSTASANGRCEYGFYIYYDFNSGKYTCGNMEQGPYIQGCEGTNSSLVLGIVKNNITVCAFFHCHTTLEYCPKTVSRRTGPSAEDIDFARTYHLPGILYDYSSHVIHGGTSKDASYKIYHFGPGRRSFFKNDFY